jgi:hypothetical protein
MAKRLSALTPATSTSDTTIVPVTEGGVTVAAQLGDSVASTTVVQTAVADIQANNAAVQTLVTSVSDAFTSTSTGDRNRANHTGNDPAANIIFSNGQTLEQWRSTVDAFMGGQSPSAPVVVTPPSAPTGSISVASVLTANNGTWSPTPSSYSYQWMRFESAPGNIWVSIPGATSATYDIQSINTGYYIAVIVTAHGSTGLTASATSPIVGPITATVPTINTAPAVSPGGTQPVGTQLSTTNGVWNNGASATYTYQWFVNDVPVGAATLATFTPIVGMEGASVYSKVRATTVQGFSTWAASNTVIISSTAAVVNTVLPNWNGTLYLGVQKTFLAGSWTGAINPTRGYSFFRNSDITPYVPWVQQPEVLHTPNASYGCVAGDTLYIEETVYDANTATTYTARSAGGVVQAIPAALSVSQDFTGLLWTVGTAISSIAPIRAQGGTTPYTFATKVGTPSLPAGLSINSATGVISGTPSSTTAINTYTILVTDAVAATAEASFTATVNAAGASALSALTYPVDLIVTGGSGTYNGSTAFSNANAFIGPAGDGFMDIHRVINAGLGSATERRAELGWLGGNWVKLICQHEYWWSFVVERIAGELQPVTGAYDATVVFQTHWGGYGDTQPEFALVDSGQFDTLRWRISGSSLAPGNYSDHGGTGSNNWHDAAEVNPWMHSGDTRPAAGVKWRYVVRYKPGWTAGHDKHVQIWRARPGEAFENICTVYSGDYTGINAYNDANSGLSVSSYPRKGLYKFSGSTWNASPMGYKISKLYFGEGTSLYDRAVAAVSWAA